MTTKQGLLYNKQKAQKIIENMQQQADPLKLANKIANPPVYNTVLKKNKEHAKIALTNCKGACDAAYSDNERYACYLGCEIKNQASSADDLFLSEKIPINNPYDKFRKPYEKIVDKKSNKKISSSYKKWDPPHTYGMIPYGKTYKYKRSCYWSWRWLRSICTIRKTAVIKRRRGIIKEGKRVSVPAVWEKCNWKETIKYPKENVGTFSEQINVGNCDDFITDKNIPEGDKYYRDYSSHELVDACKYGMDRYKRTNCIVNENKEMTCKGSSKYGSLLQDKGNYDEEKKKHDKFIFGESSVTEGFSEACKSKCADYIEGRTPIDDMKGTENDQCYDCEVKHNVFIRNDKARNEWLDTLFYTATPENPLAQKIKDVNSNYNLKKNKLKEIYHIDNDYDINSETGTYADLKKKYKAIFDKINSMTYSEKKNATINAYLEDINKRTPRKNIEYGVWLGLLVAAGITTVTLIKD